MQEKVLEGKSKEDHSRTGLNMIYRPVNIEHNKGVLKAEEEARNREIEKGKQLIDSSGKMSGQIFFFSFNKWGSEYRFSWSFNFYKNLATERVFHDSIQLKC